MDKKRGAQNVIISMISKCILLIAAIWVRRYIIRYLGNDINGLNSLFLNLLDVLSLAELGVGEAITYSMYAPIVEKRYDQVAAIYNCIKRIYRVIIIVMLTAGLAFMPFLKVLTKDFANSDVNMYLSFGCMLISTLVTYLYGPESALFTAHKKHFVVALVFACGRIFQYALQLIVLVMTRSFTYFLAVRVLASVCQCVLMKVLAYRQYRKLMFTNHILDGSTLREIRNNVGAIFMHKIGAVLVNSIDSICISTFVGVVELGKYANYMTIMTSMTGVIGMLFTPLTAVMGHMFVSADKESFHKYFNFMHGFNIIIGVVFFLGYYAVSDSLIRLLFGNNLEMARVITMILVITYFCQFSRKATLLFRDATGLFYQDRWKSLVEGIVNLILSWTFVRYWGIVGVLVATIITNVFICLVIEPYILHKHIFKMSCKKYYIRHYASIILFVVALLVLNRWMVALENVWYQLVVNGMKSIVVSIAASIIIIATNKDFVQYMKGALLNKQRIKTMA